MTSEIQTLTEEMEKLLDRISSELESFLVNLSGNLTDIECGTHIKIPIPAGYVNFYKSAEAYKMSCWLTEEITEQMPKNL